MFLNIKSCKKTIGTKFKSGIKQFKNRFISKHSIIRIACYVSNVRD